jgi:hypothetical protein
MKELTMYAMIEAHSQAIAVQLHDKSLKYERIYHSRIIAGQADGTLIYIDASGHLHVVHGTGPQASEVSAAITKIVEGVQALAGLATKAQAH